MKKIVYSLMLMGALVVAGCGGGTKTNEVDVDLINNPKSAEGYDNTTKVPVMTFDQDLHDFGRLSEGENISFSFHFRNTGSAATDTSPCRSTARAREDSSIRKSPC